MRNYPNNIRLGISAAACLFLATAILVLPVPWILAAIAAAVFHELCHIAAVYLCGGKISRLQIGVSGAVMEAEPMSRGKEWICALAGPLGSLLLLLFAKWIPRTAVCGAFHALYNLLPVYPLDGGRAFRCGAELIFPNQAEKLCNCAEKICLILIGLLAVYAAVFLRLGLFPVLMAGFLFLKTKAAQRR